MEAGGGGCYGIGYIRVCDGTVASQAPVLRSLARSLIIHVPLLIISTSAQLIASRLLAAFRHPFDLISPFFGLPEAKGAKLLYLPPQRTQSAK